jgi:hypothetical protein
MHYKELIAGVNAYYSGGNKKDRKFPTSPYSDADENPKYFDALNIRNPKNNRIKTIVNKWGKCRLHIDESKLNNSISLFEKNYIAPLNWDLQKISLWNHHEEIIEIFDVFADVLVSTGTSKALHILNPNFFVMWDENIRRVGYGCSGTKEGYFNFLCRSQKEISEIIATYKGDFKDSINPGEEISKKMYSPFNGKSKTILKLLDEYNWARYKKGWL